MLFRSSPQEMGFTYPDDPVNVSRPDFYVSVGPYEMPFGSDVHFSMLTAVFLNVAVSHH